MLVIRVNNCITVLPETSFFVFSILLEFCPCSDIIWQFITLNPFIHNGKAFFNRISIQTIALIFFPHFYKSDKYTDEKYEYRHVMLPKDLAKLVPKTHLMTEAEWRNLGVQQSLGKIETSLHLSGYQLQFSSGWIHYMLHEPEPHILLFRRPLTK